MIFHQPSNSQYNYSYNATVYQNISWQPHFHRNFEVICVLSGAVDCMVNGKRGVLKAGEFGMCLSNEVHEYRSVGASVSWVGVFSGDFVHAFEKQTKNKTGSDFRFVCPDECFRYLSAALLHPERPDLLTLKSCLYALCAAYGSQVPLVERTEKDNSPMRQIVDFIAENYRSRITLADLAGALGYDYSYTSRCFRKNFNQSFSEFINGYRIEPLDLAAFKQERARWMTGLERGGWSSCYLENHDLVRSVSRFGKDNPLAAKMLATVVLFEEGTPYLYMGEELGMTNYPFTEKGQFRDLQSKSDWDNMEKLGFSKDQILKVLQLQGRDNGRTPMQWTGGAEAGFTSGKSWIGVNPNKQTINVESEEQDPDSVLSFYKQAIRIRRRHLAAQYGSFSLVDKDNGQIYAWTRSMDGKTLFVACNFTDRMQPFPIPAGTKVLGNYDGILKDRLRPFEAVVVAC